jgi:hypothetical protein
MATNTKVNIRTENSMEKVSIYGQMVLPIKVNLTKVLDMDKATGNQRK